MNYKEMTDQEINKLVAERHGYTYKQFKIFRPDYCNNPSHAWPIILENKISIQHNVLNRGDDWFAGVYCFGDVPIETDYMENPLRAAMIVYLMMGDDDGR